MSAPLILLHEEALRITHPVFKAVPNGTNTVFVWDDDYFFKANYSLKRLIFIYETLCELPIVIIRGNTTSIVQEFSPSTLYVPETNNPLIKANLDFLKSVVPVQIVADEAFAIIKNTTDFMRFFQYWNKAEKSAFQQGGGIDA